MAKAIHWNQNRRISASIALIMLCEGNIQSCEGLSIGLLLNSVHLDLDDGVLTRFCAGLFWQTSIICDSCASEYNNTTTASTNGDIRPSFHVVDSCLSSIYSTSVVTFLCNCSRDRC